MDEIVSRVQNPAIEEIINEVPGVINSRVVFSATGEIAEVHVLAAEGRGPKQVVRDIESALLIRLDMRLDHKKISVVQLSGELQATEKRINLGGIGFRLNGASAEVSVMLALSDREAEATVKGPNSRQNQVRLVATATTQALKQLLGDIVEFVIDEVSLRVFGGRDAVTVGVTLIAPGSEENLIGAAYVQSDVKEAVVRATLDAVNRRCQKYL